LAISLSTYPLSPPAGRVRGVRGDGGPHAAARCRRRPTQNAALRADGAPGLRLRRGDAAPAVRGASPPSSQKQLRIVTLGWARCDTWPLNDGQRPNFRVVRVALDTGYDPVEGNRRALRNGRVSDPLLASHTPAWALFHARTTVRSERKLDLSLTSDKYNILTPRLCGLMVRRWRLIWLFPYPT
jgi:hypothetical protein